MNKIAAEKIAQEYYALGTQLALAKQASFDKGFHKVINALIGGTGGLAAMEHAGPGIQDLLQHAYIGNTPLADLSGLLTAGAGLGTGAGLYKGLGKLDKKLKIY